MPLIMEYSIIQYAFMHTGHSIIALAVHLFLEENTSSAFNCFLYEIIPMLFRNSVAFLCTPFKLANLFYGME